MSTPFKPFERVAVIAVHGISDHQRGETAETVALQLAAGHHGQVSRCDMPICVTPLAPAVPYARWDAQGRMERMAKSWRQSFRSDFLDARLGERPASRSADCTPLRSSAAHTAHTTQAPSADEADTGVCFTDYLIAKAASVDGAAPPIEHYNMPCHQVRTATRQTDVYDMYWADLSRLSSRTTRIVTELMTLLFHLAKLGADTLSLTAALSDTPESPQPAMRWLARLHRGAQWLYSRVLAVLFLQLLMCALLLVPAALLATRASALSAGAAGLAGVAVAFGCVYGGRSNWLTALLAGLASGALLSWGASAQPAAAAWGVMGLALGGLLWAYRAFLLYCEDRFRAVYGTGLLLMAMTLTGVAWGAAAHTESGAGVSVVAGVMRAVEVVLAAQLCAWAVMAALVTAAVVMGEWVGARNTPALRQSVMTARLGLFVSVGSFLAFVMTLWALLELPLQTLLAGLHYTPWWFTEVTSGHAADFLAQRYAASTDTFAEVAVLLLTLLGFAALAFAPSLLVEMRLFKGFAAARLGHWLTAGYRALERLVRWWSWLIVVLLVGVAVSLVGSQLVRLGWELPWLSLFSRPAELWSNALLGKLVVWVAGGTVGLVALGGAVSKRLKSMRAPLDAALDVDNHFREFPRKAIPRVEMFERYVAVLEHVMAQGYDRIVIAAHSQGTVITADLLRYLQRRHHLLPADAASDRLVQLGQQLAAKNIRLLTAGSPLRQLYALRFPSLYGWVLGAQGEHSGPHPRADLGVAHWVNVWGAGDYVGRWLWAARRDGDTIPPLCIDPAAYAGVPTQHAPFYRDLCVGADAHTHYFDLDNAVVKAELGAMV